MTRRPTSRRSPNAGNVGNGSKWIRREKRLRIYARDGWRCVWCQADVYSPGKSPHGPAFSPKPSPPRTEANALRVACLDHVVTRTRGGTNDAANLLTSCLACNEARGECSALEYADRAWTLEKTATILDRVIEAMGAPLPKVGA